MDTANTTLGEAWDGTDKKTVPLVFKLRIVYVPKLGIVRDEVFVLEEHQSLGIGRRSAQDSAEAWLQLQDERVSREHARIYRHEREMVIEDLHSRNGSAQNGVRLRPGEPAPLSDGDVLRIGDSFIVVRHEPEKVPDAPIDSVVGLSRAACLLRCAIARSALRERTVLLCGDSGTGKEVAAQAYHLFARRPGAFVAVNCAAIPESLAEAQLFGVARGAFTGAIERSGLFSEADRGTLFLDEVGELPPSLQPKLLRVLETRTVTPVGGQRSFVPDVRIIAATNRDLGIAIKNRTFREDLYARLSAEVIHLPPLRARREDILVLAERFEGSEFRPSPQLVSALLIYPFPRNIRELRNVVGSLRDRSEEEVLRCLESAAASAAPTISEDDSPIRISPSDAVPSRLEIIALLKQYQGNLSRIEAQHGYSRRQFRRWAEVHGIKADTYRKPTLK